MLIKINLAPGQWYSERMVKNLQRKGMKGFTLIELLVVIAIIGILSSVILTSLNNARQKADDAQREAQLKQISTALTLYADDHNGTYPSLGVDSRNSTNWASLASVLSPYISTLPVDPYNGKGEGYMCSNCGEYLYNGGGTKYVLSTYLATNAPNKTGVKWNNYVEIPPVTAPPYSHAGSNLYGPFFSISQGCTQSDFSICN